MNEAPNTVSVAEAQGGASTEANASMTSAIEDAFSGAPATEPVQMEAPLNLNEKLFKPVKGRLQVRMYREDCLECPKLNLSTAAEDFPEDPKCHVDNGNMLCPAGYMEIVVTGKDERQVNALLRKMEAEEDPGERLEILTKAAKLLRDKPPSIINETMARFRALL